MVIAGWVRRKARSKVKIHVSTADENVGFAGRLSAIHPTLSQPGVAGGRITDTPCNISVYPAVDRVSDRSSTAEQTNGGHCAPSRLGGPQGSNGIRNAKAISTTDISRLLLTFDLRQAIYIISLDSLPWKYIAYPSDVDGAALHTLKPGIIPSYFYSHQ